MNPFEMVVLIVAIVVVGRVMSKRHRRIDAPGAGDGGRRDDGEADRLRAEMRQLRDRIEVLERIVTDGDRNRGMALEREIEALRHDREEARR